MAGGTAFGFSDGGPLGFKGPGLYLVDCSPHAIASKPLLCKRERSLSDGPLGRLMSRSQSLTSLAPPFNGRAQNPLAAAPTRAQCLNSRAFIGCTSVMQNVSMSRMVA